jgi:PAS domain S-box-containing protein
MSDGTNPADNDFRILFETFFVQSFDLLGVVGKDGYFKRLNPAFERALGYSEAELCSKPIVEFLHEEDVATTKTRIKTLAEGTPTVDSKNRYRCKDGTYKWFSWNTTPVGSLFYSIGRDITDQVNAEKRVEAQVQQLQKMDAIGRLAGGIAHDFNNVLGAVSIYCDLLKEYANDPQVVAEHANEIKLVTERGAALTRQLLIFSRKQIFKTQTIDLNVLIQGLLKMLKRLIGENIQITTKLEPSLQGIRVDPGQIEQVILNLVVNARDSMPDGGEITLETSNVVLTKDFTSTHLSAIPGPHVSFSVTDTGCGMSSEVQDRLFEPFFTTKPIGKGTGLGLSTAYGIVKQSRGTIWVYSEPGRGSVFKVYLPALEVSTNPTEPVEEKISTSTGTETILLVEDEERLRALYSRALRRFGYTVLEANDGNEALEILEKRGSEIRLLLTDVIMPKMGGIELSKKARAKNAKLCVLYMSGYANDPIGDGAFEIGDVELSFIQKPFDTKSLLAKIRRVLSLSR